MKIKEILKNSRSEEKRFKKRFKYLMKMNENIFLSQLNDMNKSFNKNKKSKV